MGIENVFGIIVLGKVCELVKEYLVYIDKEWELCDLLENGILNIIFDCVVNGYFI